MSHYTHLGMVPAVSDRSMEQRDAILAQTGPAARAILAEIKKLPVEQRVHAIDQALSEFDSSMPDRLRRVSEFLYRNGMRIDDAVERALSLALADASIERFKKMGAAYRGGATYPVGGMGGLGGAGDTVKNLAETAFQKLSCSGQVQRTTTNIVGRNEGYDAAKNTEIGFNVARSLSQCGSGGSTPAPAAPPPPEPESRSMVWPVVGAVGALAVVGGVFLLRKKK